MVKGKDGIHIALLMMVKNEKKRLHVSLESVKDVVDSFVIYDTGSTDNTMEICEEYANKFNIPLRLTQGDFVDFSISRNVSLDFADSFEDIDYLLMLDTNDELQGGQFLRKICLEYLHSDSSGFLVCQTWFSGNLDKYYNVRLIKAHKNWRYSCPVHEYIETKNPEYEKHPIVKLPDILVLYQDRSLDDDKSGKRFHRDKELLLNAYRKDPSEPRTVFYLAQTFSCLNENADALYYYKMRAELGGFEEERFHAYLRSGELSEKIGLDWYDCFAYYIKAFELDPRVEPLLKICIHYMNKPNINFPLAFTFAKLACNLDYPRERILFVNRKAYDYERHSIMGICGYYVGQYAEGKMGCLKALEYGKQPNSLVNKEIDERNLKFYEEKEEELKIKNNQPTAAQQQTRHITPDEILTKKVFLDKKFLEIKTQNPKLTDKQVFTRAQMGWKNYQKIKKL